MTQALAAQSLAPARTGKTLAIAGIAILLGSYVINAMDRQLFPLILPEVRSLGQLRE